MAETKQVAPGAPGEKPALWRSRLWRLVGGRRLITAGSMLLVFLIWYVVAEMKVVPTLFLPHPHQAWDAFVDILRHGYKGRSLWVHLGVSLWRLGAAFILATLTAIPVGLLSGYNPYARAALDWMIEFYRPLPPLASYVILVIWLGIEDASKIALLYLAAFAPIYIACVEGVRNVQEERVRALLSLGANRWQVFRYVVLPSTLPDVFTGLRVALGLTYTTLVAAEIVAAVSGIGWMVLDAGKFLRSDIIFVGILMMGITGMLLDQIIRRLDRRYVPWRGKA